jgi:hypothetical protein
MPINFDLEKIRKEHNCINYFETGLWDPRESVSSQKALSCNFEKIYCIELLQKWVDLGKSIYKNDIESGKYTLICDDSSNMKKYLNSDVFKNKTIFFLDAHIDNIEITNYNKTCPLFDELDAIASLDRKDNVILIDDLRILSRPHPWNETSYGNINFLKEIINKISSINYEYKFTTLPGYIADDVLMAYI